jgi:hypothetical protein
VAVTTLRDTPTRVARVVLVAYDAATLAVYQSRLSDH